MKYLKKKLKIQKAPYLQTRISTQFCNNQIAMKINYLVMIIKKLNLF